ncbi:hypothetical protein ACFV9E_13855 [Streptomyces sp. NPDC059835]|uniref:hypothetical protein n=1 Tax=Streptomyces sp. NPDC059835 TaxID=3346967 RepID=UPI003666A7D9
MAAENEDGCRLLAPVTNRGDTVGVLELFLTQITADVRAQVQEAAYEARPPKDDATVLCLDWHGPR